MHEQSDSYRIIEAIMERYDTDDPHDRAALRAALKYKAYQELRRIYNDSAAQDKV